MCDVSNEPTQDFIHGKLTSIRDSQWPFKINDAWYHPKVVKNLPEA